MRNIFSSGFNLPPGCTTRHIDEAFGGPDSFECGSCGYEVSAAALNDDLQFICPCCLAVNTVNNFGEVFAKESDSLPTSQSTNQKQNTKQMIQKPKTLLSPDAAASSADPLDTPVGDPPKFPLIQDGIVGRFLVTGAEKKVNEETGNERLVFKCATQADYKSVDGDTLYKGFTVLHSINCKVTEKITAARIRDDVLALTNACGVKGPTVKDIIAAEGKPLLDKIFDATVKVQKSKQPQYSDSNVLRPLPPGQ